MSASARAAGYYHPQITQLVEEARIYRIQLASQAETIANLHGQQDFLVSRSHDDKERWQVERDSFERTIEALVLHGRIAADAATAASRPALTRFAGVDEVRHLLEGRLPLYREVATVELDAAAPPDVLARQAASQLAR